MCIRDRYVFIVPFALGGIGGPALRGIMSNEVPANQQGELAGSITSLVSFTAIFAPLVMTQLFGYFTGDSAPLYFPGAPFFLAGILMLVACVVCLGVFRSKPPTAMTGGDGAAPAAS